MAIEPDLTDNVGIESEPPLSRLAAGSAFGKLDDVLDSIRIDSGTKVALQVKASQVGMTVSEYVRLVLRANVHGSEQVISMEADRARRAIGNVG